MAKLRHIAMAVPDIQKTAQFYQEVFGMTRAHESPYSIALTDGVISLVITDNVKREHVKGHLGLHHIGFVVDDIDGAQKDIESRGGVYADDAARVAALKKRQTDAGWSQNEVQLQDQRKFLDPNGLHIEIANTEHARQTWRVRN